MSERNKSRLIAFAMVVAAGGLSLALPNPAEANRGRCCDEGMCEAASLCYDNGFCLNGNKCNVIGPSCSWGQGC